MLNICETAKGTLGTAIVTMEGKSELVCDLWMVPFSMTLSDLARHRAASRRQLNFLYRPTKHQSYIGHAHEKTTQRD